MSARVVVAWALVAVPLGYGIVETARRTATLFTGG